MAKKIPCLFGRTVYSKLIETGETQKWLIERVREDTGLYFDSFYFHKIMTGALATPSIVSSICRIMGICFEEEETK